MNSLGLQPDMLIEIDYKTDYIANQTRHYSNIARKLVETKKLAEEEVTYRSVKIKMLLLLINELIKRCVENRSSLNHFLSTLY